MPLHHTYKHKIELEHASIRPYLLYEVEQLTLHEFLDKNLANHFIPPSQSFWLWKGRECIMHRNGHTRLMLSDLLTKLYPAGATLATSHLGAGICRRRKTGREEWDSNP